MASTASRNAAGTHQPETKEGLTSWWSRFKTKPIKKEAEPPPSIFSVPLQESITYANVAISLYNDDGQTFIYGYIPIVVAKCGLYLKDNATETEGIFRLSGSAKRIKDLQAIFDQPPKYGKGLDWTGFTVHDAANILRRYLNHLPDPIIPYDWYDAFREPLKDGWSAERSISKMQELVASLPPLNRQLLLYILDLLAVFASKADINRMTSENLSAIFQPGLLTHPRDDMAPQEYKLSQEVLVFLIDNQSHFLLDSLCGPSKAETRVPAAQKKTGILRRRTLQSARRHTPDQLQTLPPEHSRTPSPRTTSTTNSGSLSRSNTVPTKRNLPSRLGSSEAQGPRHVSTPLMRPDPDSIHLGRTTQVTGSRAAHITPGANSHPVKSNLPLDQAVLDAHHLQAKANQTIQGTGSSLPSEPDLTDKSHTLMKPASTHSSNNSSPPVTQKTGMYGSRHTSATSSVAMGSESNFPGLQKASAEPHSDDLPSTGSGRPISTLLTPGNYQQHDRGSKNTKMSSSPSKFSNLFKKKPRNQSISSTSEAGGRRDLDL